MANLAQLPPIDDDPYRQARAEYSDRHAELVAGKRTWQLATLGAAALCGLSLTANIIQARQVKQLPYVVLADRSGYAITVPQPLTPSATTISLDTIERYEVAAFIRAARSLDVDVAGEDAMLRYVKTHVTGAADHFLGDYYRENNPHLAARVHSTAITIASLIEVGPHSWQVRWIETHYDPQGHRIDGDQAEHWIALLRTVIGPSGNVLANPAGIYVSNLQWTPEIEVQR
jgi:type IV secretion system protein TrbF